MDYIKSFEPLWGAWYTQELIGQGSYGRVYRAKKEELGKRYYAAIKHIPLPQDEGQLQALYSQGLVTDRKSAEAYYEAVVRSLQDEIKFNYRLKGHTNIVSYEEHRIVKRADRPGYDIFIKMELLTGLPEYIRTHPLTVGDVVRLGLDLCSALMLLQQEKIIHRDIKPGNIFINHSNHFKLGDFGVARTLDQTVSELSVKGTFAYMPPEQANGAAGDFRVDLYALGMVLYRLLNGNRGPFLPPLPALATPEETQQAIRRRVKGEPIPPPTHGDQPLWAIVQRACAHDPAQRWKDAEQMRNALEGYEAGLPPAKRDAVVLLPMGEETRYGPASEPSAGTGKGSGVWVSPVVEPPTQMTEEDEFSHLIQDWADIMEPSVNAPRPNKQRKGPLLVLWVCVLLLLGVASALFLSRADGESGMEDVPSGPGEPLGIEEADPGRPWHSEAVGLAVTDHLAREHGIHIGPAEVTQVQLELVTSLKLSEPVDTLEDLADLPNLVELWMENQYQTLDFAPLAGCTGLQRISIRDSEVLLTKMEVFLSLTQTLASLDGLQSLALESNGLTDGQVAQLPALPSLTYLNLEDNRITDLAFLTRFDALGEVSVSGNPVSDLGPLSALTALTKVYAEGCPVRDWSAVSHVEEVIGQDPEALPDDAQKKLVMDHTGEYHIRKKTLENERGGSDGRTPGEDIPAVPPNQPAAPAPSEPEPKPEEEPPAPEEEVPQTVAVTKISLSQTGFVMEVGQMGYLSAAVSPSDATDQRVTWSSSDPAVVSVNSSGCVRALASGSATITASCGGVTATCRVSVA